MATTTISELLTKHKLSSDIVDLFEKNKISAGQLVELDNEDMKELGVVALGDRKRLLKAIEEARTLGAEQEELASWPQDLPVNTRLS